MKLHEHVCTYCEGVAFEYAGKLKTHIETVHEKRRDHACPHCPSAFGVKSSLKTHIKTVHEKRRDHACPYCPGVAYQTKGHLTRHIDLVHLKIKRSRGEK